MSFVRNKFVWLGVTAVTAAVLIFGLAMMGSMLSSAPKQLPVALIMLDEGGQLPNGNQLAVGEMMRDRLLDNSQLPIRWELVATEAEAREGMNEQLYYGALVLPPDLSVSVLSQMSPAPQPASVSLLINEGMHPQAAAAVKQILGQVINGVSLEMSRQVLGMIALQTPQIPVDTAESLLTLISVNEETLHPLGINHANGAAAGLLTQIMWLGALISSIFLFLARRDLSVRGDSTWSIILQQMITGLLVVGAASWLLIGTASAWYGMELTEFSKIWLFLWLAGFAFFLLQSSLLNWLGLPAMGLLVLTMIFSMPVINLAPEFLPQFTQDWIYSWTPFRFAAQGLREIMYFGSSAGSAVSVLGWIAGISLAVLFASGFKQAATASTIKQM